VSAREHEVVVDDPPNHLPRIGHIYAFLSIDEHGNEGLCAAPLGDLPVVPLIAADPARLGSLMPVAKRLAKATRKKIVLACFIARTDIKEIAP
jgi:hypothetical protein